MELNLKRTLDNFDAEAVGDAASGLDLDVRTYCEKRTRSPMLFLISVACAAFYVLHHLLLTLCPQIPSWIWTLACTLSFVLFAAALWNFGQKEEASIFAAAGIAIGSLLLCANPLHFFLFFGLGLTLALWLADAIVVHHAYWIFADYRFSNRRRKALKRLWLGGFPNRVYTGIESFLLPSVHTSEESEHIQHCRTLAVFLLTYLLALICYPILDIRFFRGLFLVASILTLCQLFALTSLVLLKTSSRIDLFSTLLNAAQLWFGYNAHDTRAPGVLRTPAGSVFSRHAKFCCVSLIFFLGLIGATAFFPLSLLANPQFLEPKASNLDSLIASAPSEVRVMLDEKRGQIARAKSTTPTTSLLHQRLILEGEKAALFLKRYEANLLQKEQIRRINELQIKLQETPASWTAHACSRALEQGSFPWEALAGLLFSVCVPPLALSAFLGLLCARPMLFHTELIQVEAKKRHKSRWQSYIERLRKSPCPQAKNHLYLGNSIESGAPVLVHRDLLKRHAHIMGATGSGKTHRAIAPMLEQLIGTDCSVVVVDLKGDRALFETARLSAENAGVPFKWWTNERGAPSFLYNPFTQPVMQKLDADQRAEVLASALSLDHGDGYGERHFSLTHLDVLQKILNSRTSDELCSFSALRTAMKQLGTEASGKGGEKLYDSREQQAHAQDVRTISRMLSRAGALNANQREDAFRHIGPQVFSDAIDMQDTVESKNVLYFYLQSPTQRVAVRDIGKLAVYSILTAAIQSQSGRQIYLFIDEVQRIISKDLTIFLELARGAGIGVILSNQSLSQLKDGGNDFRSVVLDNTQLNIVFSCADPEFLKILGFGSGKAIFEMPQRTRYFGALNQEFLSWDFIEEQVAPRFDINDLIETGAKKELCYVRVGQNLGFSQFNGYPIQMLADFHLSARQYQKRSRSPWPSLAKYPGAFIPGDISENSSNQPEIDFSNPIDKTLNQLKND